MTVNERIKYILDKKGIGYEDLAVRLGVSKSAVSNRLNRGKEVDDEKFIEAVAEICKVPNSMILEGEGFDDLFFNEENYLPNQSKYSSHMLLESHANLSARAREKQERINELELTVKSLEDNIKTLEHDLEKKDLIIAGLEKQIVGLEKEVKYVKMIAGIE